MNTNDPVNRMLDNLRSKTLNNNGRRGDIYLADYRLLNNTSASLLFGYESQFGTPTSEEVQAAIARDFGGKLTPALSTAAAYPDKGAFKILVDMVVPTRPYNDTNNMVTVASTMFIDQEMGETWNVVEGADGIKYLVKETEDDIASILKERQRRMTATASARKLSFGSDVQASVPVNSGDSVRFYAEGSLRSGEVSKVDLDSVVVATDTGNYRVAHESIIEQTVAGNGDKNVDKQKLLDYYTKLYGREYAEKLVGPHPE